jgi:cell wall-associated NlpC family hydrolase
MLTFRFSFRGRASSAVAVALTLGLFSAASAAPAERAAFAPTASASAAAADTVERFLAEKGLIGGTGIASTSPGLVTQVRDRAGDMVLTAMNFLGVRYKRGGNSADNGFDCSGFTRQVFESGLGIVLPRRADEQAKAAGLLTVKRDELQPGDLVFFNTLRRTFSHVGLYIGDGKFVHSPKPGGEVRVEDMRLVYWAKRFTGARRAEPVADQPASADPAAAVTPTR